jgi:hypothetical protein
MAYAVFYNHEDLTSIAANVQAMLAGDYDSLLTTQERNNAKQVFQRAWTGGLSGWSTAPLAPVDRQSGDPDCRIIVVSGQQVSLQALRQVLYLLAQKVPGAWYMQAIADDLGGESGAVEPWPPV